MTMEYYFPWYLQNTTGEPKCNNKSHIYDFAGTSIEHIYPKNALTNDIIPSIEPYKNTIGNLALMDPKFNSDQGNKPFTDKRNPYQGSSIEVLKYISLNANWSISKVEDLKDKYIALAIKVFRA